MAGHPGVSALFLRDLEDVPARKHQDVPGLVPEELRNLRLRHPVPELTVNRNRELRLHQRVDQLDLLLAWVP